MLLSLLLTAGLFLYAESPGQNRVMVSVAGETITVSKGESVEDKILQAFPMQLSFRVNGSDALRAEVPFQELGIRHLSDRQREKVEQVVNRPASEKISDMLALKKPKREYAFPIKARYSEKEIRKWIREHPEFRNHPARNATIEMNDKGSLRVVPEQAGFSIEEPVFEQAIFQALRSEKYSDLTIQGKEEHAQITQAHLIPYTKVVASGLLSDGGTWVPRPLLERMIAKGQCCFIASGQAVVISDWLKGRYDATLAEVPDTSELDQEKLFFLGSQLLETYYDVTRQQEGLTEGYTNGKIAVGSVQSSIPDEIFLKVNNTTGHNLLLHLSLKGDDVEVLLLSSE